jgi:hypothetical protein
VDFTGGFTSCSIDTDISSTCFDQFGTWIFSDFFSDCAIGERPVGAPPVAVENGRDISYVCVDQFGTPACSIRV